jgi:hypothetical protein
MKGIQEARRGWFRPSLESRILNLVLESGILESGIDSKP